MIRNTKQANGPSERQCRNDASLCFLSGLFLACGAEFFDRRDILAIGTLRGRKLQEPYNLGGNSSKLHPVTAGCVSQIFRQFTLYWHDARLSRSTQHELR